MLLLLVDEKRTLQQMNLSYVTLTYTITDCIIIMLKTTERSREERLVCASDCCVWHREGSFTSDVQFVILRGRKYMQIAL